LHYSIIGGDIMLDLLVVGFLCLAVGFATGALVFRNNPEKGEIVAASLEAALERASAEIKKLKEELARKA